MILRTFLENWIGRLEGSAMEETGHGCGHNVGGVPGRDANDILVVETATLQLLRNANSPSESLSEGDLHALGVGNLMIHRDDTEHQESDQSRSDSTSLT